MSKDSSKEIVTESIRIIQSAMQYRNSPDPFQGISYFADIDFQIINLICQAVINLREDKFNSLSKEYDLIVNSLRDKYTSNSFGSNSEEGVQSIPDTSLRSEDEPGRSISSSHNISLRSVVDHFLENNPQSDIANRTTELLENLSLSIDKTTAAQFKKLYSSLLEKNKSTMKLFAHYELMEPIGFLHLERLEFSPVSIEKGELLYSLPLAPGEEVNIAHKEWSKTTRELENIVTSSLEEYDEQGVVEKNELAESVNTQDQYTSALNTQVTASGNYGNPVTGSFGGTASLGYNTSQSATRSEQTTRNQSSSITRRASTRAKKEHKISFKVVSVAGSEDQIVRKIKNPYKEDAARILYWQLLRKWKVDLHRYGVRLTYDIPIPEPGLDILQKLEEIKTLKEQIVRGFEFNLNPGSLDPTKYRDYIDQYDVEIDPPPTIAEYEEDFRKEVPGGPVSGFMEIEIPEYYEIASGDDDRRRIIVSGRGGEEKLTMPPVTSKEFLGEQAANFNTDRADIKGSVNTAVFKGRRGKFPIAYTMDGFVSALIQVTFKLKLTDKAIEIWQNRTWAKIKEAVTQKHRENVQMWNDKLAQLYEDLAADDSLTLRKKEREEIMKGVLRWFLGPYIFRLIIPELDNLYDPVTGAPMSDNWHLVLRRGDLIKFLQNAIEWENMLYILYPYYWGSENNWELKKYLQHPDPLHKIFLRSGFARVVFTIRPGFEKQFACFIETGDIRMCDDGHESSYVTIAEEMQNYAQTNYPGTPSLSDEDGKDGARILITREQKQAWTDMQILIQLLKDYALKHNGNYPNKLEELSIPTTDAWGNRYHYEYPIPGQEGYKLMSYGADGQPGGTDVDPENADISGLDEEPPYRSKHRKAWTDMQILIQLLKDYALKHNGNYPSKLEELNVPLIDPWGKKFRYEMPGEHGKYDLYTNNKEVKSWADSSLVGTWYEYTPTSAMDISFTKIETETSSMVSE